MRSCWHGTTVTFTFSPNLQYFDTSKTFAMITLDRTREVVTVEDW